MSPSAATQSSADKASADKASAGGARVGKGREPLPGGGLVTIPSPYTVATKYPNKANPEWDVRIGYRNWRSTMSGHPECDGLVAVGRTERFRDLKDFVVSGRAGASLAWSDADRIPGQVWGGDEKRFPIDEAQGENGPELIQKLAVHRVGFFDVYDEPSHLYAVQHVAGVDVAVWLYDKHGGLKGARRLADRIAGSFQP